MISYSNLGRTGHGNLGNQLFQIASCIGIAKHFGTEAAFPNWEYEKYFENPLPKLSKVGKPVKEQHFHFDFNQFSNDCDITGWLQSEKYFEDCKEEIKKQFTFNKEFEEKCKMFYYNLDFATPAIAISIRRGDYVNNPNYALLPISYYIGALLKEFPDYHNYNIIIFSDDMEYCKLHFQCLPNVYYAEGNAIEQLCLMSLCDHFIIANSTFSWWGSWLGEKEHSKVIKPNYHFGYEFGKLNNAKDFYPERWLPFDHKVERVDLTDVTFVIPVAYDHTDRKENLQLAIKNLKAQFDCVVIVGEQGGKHFEGLGDIYLEFDYKKFHRTKMLNVMSDLAGTAIVINYDADVIIPPMQIIESVQRIRNGVDFVYPYDGRFARVPRLHYDTVDSFNDVGMLAGHKFKGTLDGDASSVGGCIAYNKDSFFSAGGENENFISYNPEDLERVERFKKLGYKVERINGILYHIDHYISADSSQQNPDYNMGEFRKVKKMDKAQLLTYVQTWLQTTKKGQQIHFV